METSYMCKSEIVGRDDEKLKVVRTLTSSDNQDILSVLPIIGMGGLGKTALAQHIYNDGLVCWHFDIRIWVHVSKHFNIKKILTDIVASITRKTYQSPTIAVIQKDLEDKLRGKRFLLILDDMWNVTYEIWNKLRSSLEMGKRGSKIIGTTRIHEVATLIGTLAPHHLKFLSEDNCWSIMKNIAFGNGGADETPKMVAIGKEILKKCGGVPLAVNTLGNLMRIEKDEQAWLSIEKSAIWDLPMDEDGILPILKLSYDHLPPPLKQCFLYCSIFPKGNPISKDQLIQHWMALGFLQPSTGSKLMEDVGNEHFKYLLRNSFFYDIEKNDLGDIIKFKMHDLFFDLAHSLSRFDIKTVMAEELKNNIDVFHFGFHIDGNIELFQESLCNVGKLRSLILIGTRTRTSICSNDLDVLFKKLRHLCVLVLSDCGITELPSSIKKLKHLRYLDLSLNPIEALPASISSLYNLQTLYIAKCPLRKLPQDMRKLVNLRQLFFSIEHGSWSQMPNKMGRLICLNELLTFVVGRKRGQRIKELQCMDLRGKLNIYCLENVRSREEAKEANLVGKEKLVVLHISWGSCVWSGDVLEGLRPHPSLKELSIKNFGGDNFPQWMMRGCELALPKLVKLCLYDCERLEHVSPLGQLQCLKILLLEGAKRVKNLGNEFYHEDGSNSQGAITTVAFPSLEVLVLQKLSSLEEWMEPQGLIPSFPHLEQITIHDCPKLLTMPSRFPSLKVFQISKCSGILLWLVMEVPSLSVLHITEMPNLKVLPKRVLHSNIKELHIEKCSDLEAIVMPSEEVVQVFPSSLEMLQVSHCPSLMSLPDLQGLHSIRKFSFLCNEKFTRLPNGLDTLDTLEVLSIGGFSSSLESFPDLEPLQHLSSLRHLRVEGWYKLTSLPEQLQSLTQLEKLEIHLFHNLTTLPEWLGNLSSLRTLVLEKCNNLMYLPKEEGLRCFTTLEQLIIVDCPLLKKRCTKGLGEEWPKIKHIQCSNFSSGIR